MSSNGTMRPFGLFFVLLSMRAGDGSRYMASRTVKAQDADDAAGFSWEAELRRQSGCTVGHEVVSVVSVRRLYGRAS